MLHEHEDFEVEMDRAVLSAPECACGHAHADRARIGYRTMQTQIVVGGNQAVERNLVISYEAPARPYPTTVTATDASGNQSEGIPHRSLL
jgi:hypothetical protein